ncbi:hypothetical protein SFBM_1258 [Candidatus Arthromitus sp. SFB-mouse-Japan]|nr:hypothetical protein [Candidatus Arthromitus sp. SFB-mouse]EGX28300.1 hypothetical protein SFBNYU_003160 [Candidatus Arthromitus sp. SFB-mouse-NYU]EIA21937.1 hypothetical protein SFB2_289G11 [Candidatus Arthromitus sp. SFB-2]EIA23333.1 hypothetical protein SFB3_285G7 [Candidatus Arthromitus sp. SFB-3]EIA26201.1 hypothetical protein SFB4_270G7 [Candidatus Arthromitus sp. SFB-4]EIA27930.1 hypothetical protein SFB6_079G1 [Candidatus Arthromitus sp. SFB-co]EIA30035.1 hypothetical protein SFBSU
MKNCYCCGKEGTNIIKLIYSNFILCNYCAKTYYDSLKILNNYI